MDKVILVNKEKGYTSRDVVNIISKKFNEKKVGHFGTLDPLAEGLLIIGIGKLTKIGNFLENDNKEYEVEVLIGTETDTYDITGNILNKINIERIPLEKITSAVKYYEKKYMQEVPIYSAVKVNGRKLYEYARKGEKVTLPKKEVKILKISNIHFFEKEGLHYFKFNALVSKGTYIRSLINDISKDINIPLCMSNLIRISQDKFTLNDANTLKEIEEGSYKLLDIKDVLNLKELEIPKSMETEILNGNQIKLNEHGLILFTKNGKNIALYKENNGLLKQVLKLN